MVSACMLSHSVMSDSATLWTIACQAPLPMGFSRQEYWSWGMNSGYKENFKRTNSKETS